MTLENSPISSQFVKSQRQTIYAIYGSLDLSRCNARWRAHSTLAVSARRLAVWKLPSFFTAVLFWGSELG